MTGDSPRVAGERPVERSVAHLQRPTAQRLRVLQRRHDQDPTPQDALADLLVAAPAAADPPP